MTSSEILIFPDFKNPFILTTNQAIGAVLSQGEIGKDKPVTFISRSLNTTEENYATNEKEILAIVWALDSLRTYLYGAKMIKILTDHQPLTFALSDRKYNAKLKRWKARIEEYNHQIIYKPGKTNLVADAISRLPTEINTLVTDSRATIHSAQEDNTCLIPICEALLNVFRNQILINDGANLIISEKPHDGYYRTLARINPVNVENLTKLLKNKLKPNIANGIKIPEQYIQLFQKIYMDKFKMFKIRIAQTIVKDIQDDTKRQDRHLTAFSTIKGHLQFKRLPFG
jgi:ribonuclease HI